jgi:hypothetical protein
MKLAPYSDEKTLFLVNRLAGKNHKTMVNQEPIGVTVFRKVS